MAVRPPTGGARRRGARHRVWRWLGLGAVGAAAAVLWSRRGGALRQATAAGVGEAPRPQPPVPPPQAEELELPAGAVAAWIPGPAGALRLCERRGAPGALPVVFVHGLGGRLEQWAPQLRRLPQRTRGIAIDLPGHGGSDLAVGAAVSVGDLAGAVRAAADALALRRFVLVGHSLGAAIALEAAAAQPERVAGLLLVDPQGDPTHLDRAELAPFLAALDRDPAAELAWYYRQFLLGAPAAVSERVLEDLAATAPEVLAAVAKASVEHSPLAALDRYRGPVRALLSGLNTLPNSLHRLRPELAVRRFPGAGHWLMLEQPDVIYLEIEGFLDEIRHGGAAATVH